MAGGGDAKVGGDARDAGMLDAAGSGGDIVVRGVLLAVAMGDWDSGRFSVADCSEALAGVSGDTGPVCEASGRVAAVVAVGTGMALGGVTNDNATGGADVTATTAAATDLGATTAGDVGGDAMATPTGICTSMQLVDGVTRD